VSGRELGALLTILVLAAMVLTLFVGLAVDGPGPTVVQR